MDPKTVEIVVSLLIAFSALVWLLIKLNNGPLVQGLIQLNKRFDEMENRLDKLITREEVERLIELRITQHVQKCLDRKEMIEEHRKMS